MSNQNKSQLDRIIDVINKIGNYYPYFIRFTNIITVRESKCIDTCAMYPKYMLLSYNNDFVSSLTDDELDFVIMHELLHALHRHGYGNQRYNKDHDGLINNIAMDLEVNSVIENKIKFGTPIKGGQYPKLYGFPELLTFEEYLELMDKNNLTIPIKSKSNCKSESESDLDKESDNDDRKSGNKGECKDKGSKESESNKDGSSGENHENQSNKDDSESKNSKLSTVECEDSENEQGNKLNPLNMEDIQEELPADITDVQEVTAKGKAICNDLIDKLDLNSANKYDSPTESELKEIEENLSKDFEYNPGMGGGMPNLRIKRILNKGDFKFGLYDLLDLLVKDKMHNQLTDYSYRRMNRRGDLPGGIIQPGNMHYKSTNFNCAIVVDISGSIWGFLNEMIDSLMYFKDKVKSSGMVSNSTIDCYFTCTYFIKMLPIEKVNRASIPSGDGGNRMFEGFKAVCENKSKKYDNIIIYTDALDSTFPQFKKYNRKCFVAIASMYRNTALEGKRIVEEAKDPNLLPIILKGCIGER